MIWCSLNASMVVVGETATSKILLENNCIHYIDPFTFYIGSHAVKPHSPDSPVIFLFDKGMVFN